MRKAAIIGATGYGGAELVRILHQHPHVSIHSVHASTLHGEPLVKSFPHMQELINHRLEAVNVEKISQEADIIFTATPSGVARDLVPGFLKNGTKVIDLSGDFRITNQEIYEQWYGIKAADQALLNQAVYGLTEWIDMDVTETNFISNPGCFPTAVLLGLAPLVKQQKIDGGSIIIDAKTGVSGSGKGLSQVTHFSGTNDNFKIYKVNQHQHTPEIEQGLKKWHPHVGPVTFSTHLAPMTRGIMATMYMTATEKTATEDLIELYQSVYENDPFIRIHSNGSFPTTKDVSGSNFCDIGVTYDERTNRIMVISVIDNLIKGASGQAVQNMNKMLGIDEKTGIDFMPVFP
ncbi:N-acetyl-gamma-glutamyl-phosphate reductase [Cerasibacillus terrae]|uniref:N-acetyl-gamma-glutamyl-phosphate reductase n=1 Tax=Cerasibacillus terrae TaxID=2498845 RepID=A0A5C8NYR5_9BACI|nr:N-acetyl-gamma-glutamyl-phosphate reductase [Cerasibacillus terrae]TXL66488.1 N-acetyl-gamma-glutamyl-phosphate reductase [Cerasibacillus terrae]